MASRELLPLSPSDGRIVDLGASGRGVVATRKLEPGEVLFKEYPLIAMQHGSSRAAGCLNCARCFRFVGSLETQVCALLAGAGGPAPAEPFSLPAVPGWQPSPAAVPCPGGCGAVVYCSAQCAQGAMDSQHSLLCAGLRRADDFAAKAAAQIEAEEEAAAAEASGVAMDVAGSPYAVANGMADMADMAVDLPSSSSDETWEAAGAGMGPRAASLARFEAHARATNEVFLLAAQAVAHILLSLRRGVALEAAMAPFDAPPWWDAVAFDGSSPGDEPSFRLQLRQLATDSWRLLVATLGADAPPGCALFVDVALYGVILGAFERRNCAVLVSSPVENYFLAVDDLDDGPQKEAVTAVTQPVLDALDDAYATPCEGIGLFPLQAMLNHSCEPNVSLQKGEDDEDDGRVVATVAAPVAAGTELCNAYIDVELPLAARRRELREYGFVCVCARCVREAAAGAATEEEEPGMACDEGCCDSGDDAPPPAAERRRGKLK